MNTQHTPGPWQVKPSNNEITNADHGRLPFAIVAGYSLIGATYENGKDALLIAAAPELLFELKKCASLLKTALGETNDLTGKAVIAQRLESVTALIAKAT